ncbi:UNC93-like protein 3 [Helianthus annuus]|uniref:Putative major facilitator superfamily protein n=1 Tax=Helianthus annuus TaxID=4232 RepID=A0A251UBI3_HELAN|nr:UNC93-like protein 3 [Helianthus annuus]
MALDEESPLVDHQIQAENQTVNHGRDIHILSWAFLLIFLAYGAAQNLQSTLNTDGDLGTISLGILYTSFTVSSLFASSVVRKLGSKNALLLGTTGYWLYIAANLKPSWYTMVPASLYLGFAAAILWVGEGTYLTATARSQANDHKLHEGTVIGHFNGEFWGIFASHQLVGNLLTLALLKDGAEGSTSGTTLLFTVFLGSMTLGTVLMSFLKKRDGEETEGDRDSSPGLYTLLASLWNQIITPLCDVRMLLIVPLIAFSGLQQAFVWAEFTKYYVQPSLGESGVGGAMAVYGVFDAICSLAAGRFTSGLTSITLIVSGGAFLQGGILIWLLNYSEPTDGVLRVVYPLLIAAVWGIGDGVLMTQLNALLAMLFKHNMEGTFAQLKLWQSASIAVVFFLSPYISLQTMLFLMLAALVLSLVGFLFLVLKVEKVFSNHVS